MTAGVEYLGPGKCTPVEQQEIVRTHYLPGEMVRLVPDRVIDGEDDQALQERISLGPDALEIERTIVTTGTSQQSYVTTGTSRQTYKVAYTFVGRSGRHAAMAFEDARGSRHFYGTMIMMEGRMWIVSMTEDRQPDGEVHEIVGVHGRFIGDPLGECETFDMLRDEIGMGGEGEFVVHPIAIGATYDPAVIGGIPWWGPADVETIACAHAAVIGSDLWKNRVKHPNGA